MNAKKVKRYELMVKAAPLVMMAATALVPQLAHAAAPSPNEICIGSACIRFCFKWGIISICL